MKRLRHLLTLTALYICLVTPVFGDRLKDLTSLAGIRSNQLVGYGVVVGLAGTGDGNTDYSSIDAIIGFEVRSNAEVGGLNGDNMAAVMIIRFATFTKPVSY